MGNMLRMCLNWKVLAGLGMVAVGVGMYRPDLLGAALPILLLAACPLSMVWMMRAMNHRDRAANGTLTPGISDDPAELRARMNLLAAEQEQISEQLARLRTPASPGDDRHQMIPSPPDTV